MRIEFIALGFVLLVGALSFLVTGASLTGMNVGGDFFKQVLISKNFVRPHYVYCTYWDYDNYDAWGNYQPTPCFRTVRQEGVRCDPPETYDINEKMDGYVIAKPCSGGLTVPMSGMHQVYRRTMTNYYRKYP